MEDFRDMGIKIKTSDNFDIGIIPIEKFTRSMYVYDLVNALLFIQRINADLKDSVCKKVYILSPYVPQYLDKWFLITTEANAFIAKYLINFFPQRSNMGNMMLIAILIM